MWKTKAKLVNNSMGMFGMHFARKNRKITDWESNSFLVGNNWVMWTDLVNWIVLPRQLVVYQMKYLRFWSMLDFYSTI